MGQTKSRWGRIFKNAADMRLTNLDVDLYAHDGDSLYQLVESDSIDGYYYYDSVAVGMYDVYIGGTKKYTGIWIGANILSKLAANLQSNGQLIGSSGIKDRSITAVKIGSGVITSTELGANSVGSSEITDGSVTTGEILDGTIKEADLSDGSVTSAKVLDSTLVTADLNVSLLNYINAAGGGSITNNPDNVTLENKTGSTIGIKDDYRVYPDTITMSNAVYDTSGVVVNLKQLSSANTKGGGQFVTRPAAEYAVDGINIFASGNASYEWVRQEVLQGGLVNVEWAGAIPGSGDDTADMQSAANAADALNLPGIYVPEGIFNVSDPLVLPSSKQQNEDFVFQGAGRHRTYIVATDTAFGQANVGYTRGIAIHDMTIQGPGKGTAGSIGLVLSYYSNPKFSNLYIENFEKCIDTDRLEGALFERVWMEDNVWGAYMMGSTQNGITFQDCYWGASDSSQVRVTNCNALKFDGGEAGNAPIFIELGVFGSSSSFGNVEITGMNIESVDSTFFIVHNLSDLKVSGTKLLLGVPGSIAYSGYSYGNSRLLLERSFLSNGYFYSEGANSRVLVAGQQQGSSNIQVYRAAANRWVAAAIWDDVADNAIPTPDSSKVGRLIRAYSRTSTNVPERYYMYHRFSTDEFARTNLLSGSDWRGAITDVQPAPVPNIRFVTKYFNVTFGATGDSTIYTAILDTNGWTTIYYANAVWDDAGNAGFKKISFGGWSTSDGAAGAGTVDLIFLHNGDTSVNGITRRVRLFAILVPRKWGSN